MTAPGPDRTPPDPALPDATLRYAEHVDGLVDVHLPPSDDPTAGPAAGLLVLLHGGFWKQEYDRRHTRPLARLLAGRGWVVATPEYRRVGVDPATGERGTGGWPTTADDVRRATQALPDLLPRIGVETGDLDRTVVVGHSAGGHLALWLACAGVEGVPVDRWVATAPACDLRESARLGLGDGAAQAFLGGEPDGPAEASYDAADPMTLLHRFDGTGAPDPRPDVVVLHGTRDTTVPISLSRGLVVRHPWVRLEEVDSDHFSVLMGFEGRVTPGDPAYAALLDAVS